MDTTHGGPAVKMIFPKEDLLIERLMWFCPAHAVETQEVKAYEQKHKAISSIPVVFLMTWASIFHPQCIMYVSFWPFSSSYVTTLRTAVLYVSSLDLFVRWGQCSFFRAGLEDVLGGGDRSQHLAVCRNTSYSILRSCSFQILILSYITGGYHTFAWHL